MPEPEDKPVPNPNTPPPAFDQTAFMASLTKTFDDKLKPLSELVTKQATTIADLTTKLDTIAKGTAPVANPEPPALGPDGKPILPSPDDMKYKTLERKLKATEDEVNQVKTAREEEKAKALKLTKKAAVTAAVSNPEFEWAGNGIKDLVTERLINSAKVLEDESVVIVTGDKEIPITDYVRSYYSSDDSFQAAKRRSGGSGATDKDNERNKGSRLEYLSNKPASSWTPDESKEFASLAADKFGRAR